MNLNKSEIEPDTLVFLIDAGHVDDVLAVGEIKNTDALTLLGMAKELGGHAVFFGNHWEEDAGVFGTWSGPDDTDGLMAGVRMVMAKLDDVMADKLSGWVMLTDEKTDKRMQRYLRKQMKKAKKNMH